MNYILALLAMAGLGYAFYHLWRVFRPGKRESVLTGAEAKYLDADGNQVSIQDLVIDPDGIRAGWEDVAKPAEYWLEWHETFDPTRANGIGEATYTVTFRSLQDQLQKAIETENYEEAARLRDKIKEEE